MAPAQKRGLPSKVEAMKARKRAKLGSDVTDIKPIPSKPQHVQIEQLAWKEISMPDRMDDYEGFFGLEELDGVDVVRENDIVRFVAPKAKITAVAEDEDWDGFNEDAPAAPAPPAKKQKPAKEKKVKKPKQSDQSKVTAPTMTSTLATLDDASTVDTSAWQSLKLSPDTLAALSALGFAKPTRIQTETIPVILSGVDVVGKASTGSGKTLAFGIPILETFLETRHRKEKAPLALILSPTRELAHQLNDHITALCSKLTFQGPSIVTLTGGLSLQKQRRQLKTADVIIGTPGRLWEVISSENGLSRSLKDIQYLVLDEADRLLSEGHFKELDEILNVLDREDDLVEDIEKAGEDGPRRAKNISQRQTLVFSATFDKDLQKKLVGKIKYHGTKGTMDYLMSKLNFQGEPQFIDANPKKQLAVGLKEGLIECGGMEKDLYLYTILLHNHKARTIVFVNSINAVRRVAPFLENLGLPAIALHSGMIQKARMRSLERFKSKASILVATDVAARGLDIPDVDLVVHYHLPRTADMYVHRSGRTARAGKQGSSVLICGPEEVMGVRRLVAKVHAQAAESRNEDTSEAAKQGYYIRTLDPDRKVVARLKPRATIAKKLTDITTAKEKHHKEESLYQEAAEDLGIDMDDEEFTKVGPGRRGRGAGRIEREIQARSVSKSEAAAMRAELKALLKERINVGVSERYITSGRIDVQELLRQQETGEKTGEFLGSNTGFAMDDVL